MSKQVKRLYEFGPFRIDTENRLLSRDGKPIPLKPKVVSTLLLLIENHDRVIEKDELINALWPDSFVEEGNLTQNIYVLRKALTNAENDESYIETIPRRGYRFVGPVRESTSETNADLTATDGEVLPIRQPETAKPARVGLSKRWIWISSLLAVALLALGGYLWISNQRKRAAANPAIKSLAVLPFKPLNSEAADEYMGQGMADALITKLSNSRRISVRPTSVVLRYSALGQDPLAAGRELGVDVVLDGKIQRAGDRVRVTVQLLRVADGASLWAEQYDETFTNIFAVQDSISAQAAHSLMPQLSGSERALMLQHYTRNAAAYEAYLQGRYYWNKRTAAGFKKAMDYFQQAIQIDQNYALAYAGLADCYIRLNEFGVPMAQEAVPRGRAAVMKALQIDDALAEAHATLAFIKFRHDWDFAGADQEFKRSLELDANYSEAHQWYAFFLLAVSKTNEADTEMKRAQELDPLSLGFNSNLALYLFFRHQFDQSIQQCLKTLEMEPNFILTRFTLGLNYEQKGMNQEAIAEFKKARDLSPNDAATLASALGHALAKGGQVKDARALLRDLEERAKKNYVPPYSLAVLYAGLGENARALESLEVGFQDRSLRPVWLKYDSRLDGLRQDGKFAGLVQRIGLTP
ncbi:MAG TPA: winged helix-turn-helix domain-containing protein [Pyrinomonadaceae bacterium]|nr:winged helix-turn-helix domain-containing protein [Pyrinomonadaceae bacterium]